MNENEIKRILEALLMVAQMPLTINTLQSVFPEGERPSILQLQRALDELARAYEGHALELKFLASGYRLQIKESYSPWIARLLEEKPAKYSKALLETLAIIAYKQPVTRAEIEDLRGVSINSSILKTLLDREWVKIGGYRDVPGKPAVFVTTKAFLDYFNLQTLNELPPISIEE